MDESKMTTWYPGHVKPARDGVYQAIHGGWEHGFARFESGVWQMLRPTIEAAAAEQFSHGASQNKQWRGLSENPNA